MLTNYNSFSLAKEHFYTIWPIDMTQSGATTSSQSEPGSDGNERVLHIPQAYSITGPSASDCLV